MYTDVWSGMRLENCQKSKDLSTGFEGHRGPITCKIFHMKCLNMDSAQLHYIGGLGAYPRKILEFYNSYGAFSELLLKNLTSTLFSVIAWTQT